MHQKSIIIVGNGSSLINSNIGEKIDSFDSVVRFNSYKIKGYEKDVGTKTNILFTCNRSHISDAKMYDRIIVHSWQWDENKDAIFQDFNKIRKCEKTTREFVRSRMDKKYCPSTGLIAIHMILEDSRYKKPVFIVGFDWWETEKHHYGDNERRGTIHKPELELKIISDLQSKGLIEFL